MNKYIKYSLMFIFAFCSIIIFNTSKVQALSSDDLSALTFYDIKNSTKDNSTYYSFSNTYLKGLIQQAYDSDGLDISSYNYFIVLQNGNEFTYLCFNNYVSSISLNKDYTGGGYVHGYMLDFDKKYNYARFIVSISDSSASMSQLSYFTQNGYRYDKFYTGISTNMNFKSLFATSISATQYTSPTLSWSGNYSTDYSVYSLFAQINTPNKIKYYITAAGSNGLGETKDFPTGGKLDVTNDCKIYLYGVDENGTRCTVNYECDVTNIRQS